jgi:penicillin-binding protein 1B
LNKNPDNQTNNNERSPGLFISVFRFIWGIFKLLFLAALIIGILAGLAYVLDLNDKVTKQFEGRRWALPARVFSRPLELYEGKILNADNLEKELSQLLHYRNVEEPSNTGEFKRNKSTFVIHTRGFRFDQDIEPERLIKLTIKKGKVSSLSYLNQNNPLTLMRLEPSLIGNFYPHHNEDRVLVRLKDVSPMLIKGLIAVEDKKFYDHWGVNPMSIARAMKANYEAGRIVQGGSTLTQQLVKNHFLTNEKTWERKVNEFLIALILEGNYEKDEILESYLNEIYLGQDGNRAIHGFGLASQFYFNRPIRELQTHQVAMLIGLAKGASYYNPRRNPEKALQRRNLVLDLMVTGGAISAQEAENAKLQPLSVVKNKPTGVTPFPAYLELVRKQLKRDYREEDLSSEGLMIFTSMDPIYQLQAESVVRNRVRKLERSKRIRKGRLNGAMVLSTVQGGEILAVVGGRDARYAGYNRAVDAKRQIGSTVKPPIYLTALENKKRFTLGTRLNDGPVTVKVGRKYWNPRNYDHRNLGTITLFNALVKSRNTPTVRIGVKTGIETITKKLRAMGVDPETNIPQYPAMYLGALELSVMEVQQLYQTIAAGGSYSPLKSIRSVMNTHGETLTRYPIKVKQVASPEATYLVQHAMHEITRTGTAKYLAKSLPGWKKVAGKTGTTNNKRDSWFAGFSGEHVISVWVGRDDNKPTGLTGGDGALRVWSDMMKILPTRAFKPKRPGNIQWVKVDKRSGLRFNPDCSVGISLPFIKGSAPRKKHYCAPPPPPEPVPVAPATPANGGGLPSNWVDELMR